MKIARVEAIVLKQPSIDLVGDGSQDTVLIEVETDTGIIGYGEVDSNPYVVKQIIESPASHMACIGLRDLVLGEDPLNPEKIWRKMYKKSIYYGRRSAVIHAMSGIDMAVWDIMGKALGVSVSRLLGGRYREKIQAYCSVLMPENEEGIKRLVDRHMPKGYQGLKLGWGALGQSAQKDRQLARAARRALGDGPCLMLDIGMVWTDWKEAVQTCHSFEQQDVFWVEEPFGPDDLSSYRMLRERVGLRVSGGEEVGTIHEYDELLRGGCVDVVQPDLSRCGGFTVAKQLTTLAGLTNTLIVPHAFKTGVLMAATLQYLASLPAARYLEYCEQDTVLRQTLTVERFPLNADGTVDIPDEPGLGVTLDTDIINKYRVA